MCFCFIIDICVVICQRAVCTDIYVCVRVCMYMALFLLFDVEVGLLNDVHLCRVSYVEVFRGLCVVDVFRYSTCLCAVVSIR